MLIDDRPTIASPDDDPYLWLEEIEGEGALAFVARQSKLTLERFGDAGFADDRDTLTAIYDRPDNIPYVTRRGGFVYNLWKDAINPRGLWRRTTLDEFRGPNPKWKPCWMWTNLPRGEPGLDLDLDKDAARCGSARDIEPFARRQRRGHAREFDIEKKAFASDGFVLPEAKGGAEWLDADTLLLSSAYAKAWQPRPVTPEPSGCGGAART